MRRPSLRTLLALTAAMCCALATQAQTVLTEGTNLSVDASDDGQLAMDLMGSVWLVPANGGAARRLIEPDVPAREPRWSPDNRRLLYRLSTAESSQLWILDVDAVEATPLTDSPYFDRDATWHPDGRRVTFASDRRSSGLDLWEIDLDTGLEWRLSSYPGDETDPAWSSNGRDLVFVHYRDGEWTLTLRRFGQADVALVSSAEPLAAPSWRPDGTLITYLRRREGRYALQMVILSDPPLIRQLGVPEDFTLSPVSWQDRTTYFYAAGGRIRTRGFDEWVSRTVAFRATVGLTTPAARPARPETRIANRDLPLVTPPDGKLVIRSPRLFDGLGSGYLEGRDILVEGGLIAAVAERQDWGDVAVLDLGNTTVLPGLIDVYSALPETATDQTGAQLLAWGVTTIVSPDAPAPAPARWEEDRAPGPRLLSATSILPADQSPHPADDPGVFLLTLPSDAGDDAALGDVVRQWQERGRPVLAENWRTGAAAGADMLLGAAGPAASPLGHRYRDQALLPSTNRKSIISGLADAGTPGLQALFGARQASGLRAPPLRRLGNVPDLRGKSGRLIVGSRPNRLPAGLALHAELRALVASGLDESQVLKAAGTQAARILGLSGQIGEITAGARADLILVNGDPLTSIGDVQNVVAVVRNGRFYSLVSLLERARPSVE